MTNKCGVAPKDTITNIILFFIIVLLVVYVAEHQAERRFLSAQSTFSAPIVFGRSKALITPTSPVVAPLIRAARIERADLRKLTYTNRKIMRLVLTGRPYDVAINRRLLHAIPHNAPFSLRANNISFQWLKRLVKRANPGETTMTFFDEPVRLSSAHNGYTVSICLSGLTYLNAVGNATPTLVEAALKRYSFLNEGLPH